ncbi:cytidine deaminase [Caloranaerobacter azorensis]|uniref:Cytidine deaminase n=3 Tax=Caloranaerobacter azorensis TaxID=116090 RepID=A0A1M5S8P3_9FIRM|nr:cytidine deaminase [Caloranaerobacter azorensis]KGG80159.1 cytidine deaminase [Caloranaerobacter azorensis H53214]QIB26302.1 cytidine deaminase [Caloranaerobacter azorensis]SHH34820.1 cytidine deaminase [Caloranaerobacter azorensis DSM 13643]
MDKRQLIKKALEAKEKSYAPYSNFHVGAALLTKNGKIYTGCNIESASYTPTNCAERTAIFKAVSEGDREFVAIAIVGDSKTYTYPCGVCRQVIREFGKDIKIIVAKSEDDYKEYDLEELFPHSFGPEDLNVKTGRE